MIDVSELLADPDFVEEIAILRRTLTMTNGRASYSTTPDTIFGSIQPASGEILTTLPEGVQLADVIMVYTASDLRADGDGTPGDIILDGGRQYVVRSVPEAFRRFGFVGAIGVAKAMSGVRNGG